MAITNETSDAALLAACRQGDRTAWETLLQRYERLVFSIALSHGLPAADAADITQMTFTAFLRQLDDLDDDSNLSAWLATVARRNTWRLLQKRRREDVIAAQDLTETLYLLPDEKAKQEILHADLVEWMMQGLNALDERCRRLLLALYFDPEQPSYADVAAALGVAEGSVGPTRARCLQRLKERLEERR